MKGITVDLLIYLLTFKVGNIGPLTNGTNENLTQSAVAEHLAQESHTIDWKEARTMAAPTLPPEMLPGATLGWRPAQKQTSSLVPHFYTH